MRAWSPFTRPRRPKSHPNTWFLLGQSSLKRHYRRLQRLWLRLRRARILTLTHTHPPSLEDDGGMGPLPLLPSTQFRHQPDQVASFIVRILVSSAEAFQLFRIFEVADGEAVRGLDGCAARNVRPTRAV